MINHPLVSIIVPVFNASNTLSKCIESIIKQQFSNIELLLINDGSKDNSGRICDKYAKIDKRIKVFHQQNSGVSKARNLGLDNAKGKWILFVDSDDFISGGDNSLMNISHILEKEDEIDLVQFSVCLMKNDFPILVSQKDSMINCIITISEFLLGGCFKKELWRYFFKRETIEQEQLRFLETVNYGEDWNFVVRYIRNIKYIYVSKIILYNHIFQAESLMTKIFQKPVLEQHFIILSSFVDLVEGNNRKWDSFIKKQICEIYHFYLFIFSKCQLDKISQKEIVNSYRKLYRENFKLIGINFKFILAYLSPELYIKIAKQNR